MGVCARVRACARAHCVYVRACVCARLWLLVLGFGVGVWVWGHLKSCRVRGPFEDPRKYLGIQCFDVEAMDTKTKIHFASVLVEPDDGKHVPVAGCQGSLLACSTYKGFKDDEDVLSFAVG